MPRTHDAFISYSHSADNALAPALESALERLAKPTFKLRAIDVFRDKTSLSASPALWTGIVEHLSGSRWFLLLASPQAAASPWCNKEIQWWLANRDSSTMLIAVTGGDIVWDAASGDFDWSRTTALPPSLRGQFKEEPFYCDLRWARSEHALSLRHTRFRSVALDLAATIRGVPKDELDGEDVRQVRRTKLLARAGVSIIVIAAAMAVWQAIEATAQRRLAEVERDRALSRMLAAQANELRLREPRLSLLLAAQALATFKSAEASASLLRTLNAAPFDRIVEHSESLWSLAVSNDERWAVLGDGRGATVRADLGSGLVEPLIPSSPGRAPVSTGTLAVAISSDGQRVAAGGFDQTITVWRSGRVDRQIASGGDTHEGFILDLSFSTDGRTLASAGSDGRALIHDLESGAVQKLVSGWKPEMSAVRFSPDGGLLAAGGDNATVLLFRRPAGARVPALHGLGASSVEALGFARGGAELFVAFFDRSVGVYDTRSGALISRIGAPHHATIETMAVAPDGASVVTGHSDGEVLAWTKDGASSWTSKTLYRHSAAVRGAAFLPRSARVATIGFDGRLFVTRGSQLPPFARELWRVPDAFHAASVIPSAKRIVFLVGDASKTVSLETGAPMPDDPSSLAAAARVRHQTLADDGRARTVVVRDGKLVIEEHGTRSQVILTGADGTAVRCARFSPDGRTVYALRGDELGAWDARTGARSAASRRLPDTGLSATLAVSADGRLIAVARSPGIDFSATGRRPAAHLVTVLRAGDFQLVAETLESIPGAGSSEMWGETLFFTPDGSMLALKTGSTMTVWDLSRMQRLDEPIALPAFAQALGFGADPRKLLLAVPSTRALIELDLNPESWAAEACRLAARRLTAEEWARYVSRDLAYRAYCGP